MECWPTRTFSASGERTRGAADLEAPDQKVADGKEGLHCRIWGFEFVRVSRRSSEWECRRACEAVHSCCEASLVHPGEVSDCRMRYCCDRGRAKDSGSAEDRKRVDVGPECGRDHASKVSKRTSNSRWRPC